MSSDDILEVQLDDSTLFEVTIYDGEGSTTVVDLSAATSKQIVFQKHNRRVLEATASFVTDGTDGKLEYRAQSGDLNVKGDWKLQGRTILPDGPWNSNIVEFKVLDNL